MEIGDDDTRISAPQVTRGKGEHQNLRLPGTREPEASIPKKSNRQWMFGQLLKLVVG